MISRSSTAIALFGLALSAIACAAEPGGEAGPERRDPTAATSEEAKGGKGAEKAAEKPAENAVEKPAEKPAENAAEKPAEKPQGYVTFAREAKERLGSVPISKQAFDAPKVLFSVKLEDFVSEDDLLLRSEFTLSTCGEKDVSGDSSDGEKSPCSIPELKQSPYSYTPHFGAYLVLADDANDTKGDKVSPVFDTTCTMREHHCTVVVPETRVKKPSTNRKFVNLVVGADHGGARGFDLMLVEQGHGMLSVTRVGKDAGGVDKSFETKELETKGEIDIDQDKGDGDDKVGHIIYRQKLTNLQAGDVIDVDARMFATLHAGPAACDPLIVTEVLLTRDAGDREAKGHGAERLTANNGTNCVDHSGQTKYEKSGAVQIGAGAPSIMYLSLVAKAGRTCVPDGFNWEVKGDGFLKGSVRHGKKDGK